MEAAKVQIGFWKWRALAAVCSGLLLSSAFAPLNWDIVSWIAIVPLMLIPFPATWRQRLGIGFLFGYAHFATCLHWLNEVGFGAGYLLAAVCAIFVMLWYALTSAFAWRLRRMFQEYHLFGGGGIIATYNNGLAVLIGIFASCLWVAQEFLRAHICTGFPWNQLGITQVSNAHLAGLASYGGVYIVSFLVILVNSMLAAMIARMFWSRLVYGCRRQSPCKCYVFPWDMLVLLLALAMTVYLSRRHDKALLSGMKFGDEVVQLKALAVQGNIPQCRSWSHEEYEYAMGTYEKLTLDGAVADGVENPDLVLWPECAVPSPIVFSEYALRLKNLVNRMEMPLLVGALDMRLKPGAVPNNSGLYANDDFNDFNSAFLLTRKSGILYSPLAIRDGVYDKIHLVPFGEYVPWGKYFPWLADFIGMGRDLTAGRNYRIFELAKGVKAGVNICFEDAFPGISRHFALNGANMLVTLTNDVWYNRSSGAQQHLNHAIFRAIENRLPLIRVGNNSHTCLIMPNGDVVGISPEFQSAAILLKVPVALDDSPSFYAIHGDVFAWFASGLAIIGCIFLAISDFVQKSMNYEAINGKSR